MQDFEHDCLNRFHDVDLVIQGMQREINELRQHCQDMHAWRAEDMAKSEWYYSVRHDLQELVESARWLKTTRRIVIWSIGAIAGAIMAYQSVVVWLKEHLK